MYLNNMTNARCIDLHIPAANGGISITSFCFERTALAYAREINAPIYKIMCNGHTLRSEGLWPR